MISQSKTAGHTLDARQAADKITATQREQRNGHRGLVIWLTGLSGAGKTTIATELERQLFNEGKHTYLLDGDIVRHGLCSDLDFSAAARRENIRRAGQVAALFADAGVIVIAAFISPSRADREGVRHMLSPGRFIEVFVNAPLEICEQRDVKGLYAKARANQIKEFTGVSAPYEAPQNPEIELHTDLTTPQEAVAHIVDYLHRANDRG
ncbi:MAG TPA: adenylyl-sulfate kinase [Candidatus Limnocylindria bacterium]|nr:adenylyl-sulfate kinase [Candidatus Limnocylindria bacterium]